MNQTEKNQAQTAEAIENLDENQAAQAGCQAQTEAKPMKEYIKKLENGCYDIISIPETEPVPEGYLKLLPLDDGTPQRVGCVETIKLVFTAEAVYFKLLERCQEISCGNIEILNPALFLIQRGDTPEGENQTEDEIKSTANWIQNLVTSGAFSELKKKQQRLKERLFFEDLEKRAAEQ